MKAASRINKNNILLVCFCMFDRSFGDIYRILFISHGENFYSLFLTVYLQLCDRSRTIYVTGNEKWSFSFGFQLTCKFRNCGRLTCTLKSSHHQDCDIIAWFQRKIGCFTSHQINQLFIYDLDYHLSWIQTIHDILSYCTFLHRLGKLFNNPEVNICFKKSHLDLFQSNLNILFCQASFASQLFEHIL